MQDTRLTRAIALVTVTAFLAAQQISFADTLRPKSAKQVEGISSELSAKIANVPHTAHNAVIKDNVPEELKSEDLETRKAKLREHKDKYPYFEGYGIKARGIPIQGYLKKTGHFGHIGLGRAYGEPVFYYDPLLEKEEIADILAPHELYEISKWEAKRKELGLTPSQMRRWIKENYQLAKALNEQFHEEANKEHNVGQLYKKYGVEIDESSLDSLLATFSEKEEDTVLAAGASADLPQKEFADLIEKRFGDSALHALPSALDAGLTEEGILKLFDAIVDKCEWNRPEAFAALPSALDAAKKHNLTIAGILSLFGAIVDKCGWYTPNAFDALPSALDAGLTEEGILELFGAIIDKCDWPAPSAFAVLPPALDAAKDAGLTQAGILSLFGTIVDKWRNYTPQAFAALPSALDAAKKYSLLEDIITRSNRENAKDIETLSDKLKAIPSGQVQFFL